MLVFEYTFPNHLEIKQNFNLITWNYYISPDSNLNQLWYQVVLSLFQIED